MGMFGIVVGAITTVVGIVKDDEELVNDNIGDLVPPVAVFWYR